MRASPVHVSSLPQTLQDELSSPFLKDATIENEYSELAKFVVGLVDTFFDEELIEIKGDEPLFTRNESSERSPIFLTSSHVDVNLNSEPEDDIFVVIDYSNLRADFSDVVDARDHLNEWGGYVNDRLKELTPFAPKIKFHIYESNHLQSFNVLKTYNQLYHPKKTSYEKGYVDPVTPRVIIDCGEHINLPLVESENQTGYPHFQILYSIVNSSTQSNREEEITNLVSKLGNGFAVVHDTKPSMKVVANILELTCVIAARFTYSDKSSNLIESMLKGCINSSSRILGSKSSNLSSQDVYRELPIIPKCVIERLSSKWEKCGEKSSFFDNLVNFDNNISDFDYRCSTDLRIDLERFNSKLFEQCRELMMQWMEKMKFGENETVQSRLYKYLNTDTSNEGKERRKQIRIEVSPILKTKDLDFDECKELVKTNAYNARRWRPLIIKNLEGLFNSLELRQNVEVQDNFIGINFTELNRSDMYVLLRILVALNKEQFESYQSISTLHHSKNDNKLLRRLEEYKINLKLVDHFAIYGHLKDYLNAISNSINSLNLIGKQHVANMVSHFYGIKPFCEIGGEEE